MSTGTLRKIGLFGIGIIVLTQEKLEEFIREMIKKGDMNREEGKKFVIETGWKIRYYLYSKRSKYEANTENIFRL